MIQSAVARAAAVASGSGSEPSGTQPVKVDMSRGERIGRVASEWFSHPDDQRYFSLSALHQAVLARAERATARTVETRALRVEVTAMTVSASRSPSLSAEPVSPTH